LSNLPSFRHSAGFQLKRGHPMPILSMCHLEQIAYVVACKSQHFWLIVYLNSFEEVHPVRPPTLNRPVLYGQTERQQYYCVAIRPVA